MGILVVLALWGVAAVVVGSISSIVLFALTFWLTRNATSGRRFARVFAPLLPFACIAIGAVGFAGYAVINDTVFNRDPGLGDTWYTPVPNGYTLEAIDVTDEGMVYNRKTQRNPGSVSSQPDAVFGVRRLQVDGSLIAGSYDSQYMDHMAEDSKAEDHFFTLDTATGKETEFKSLSDLNADLAQRGLHPHLRTFWDVFCDYRNTWFDWLTVIVGLSVPIIGLALLAWIIVQSRSSVRPAPTTA